MFFTSQAILTKNTRNWYYLRQNSSLAKKIADSKIRTKKILTKAEVPVPKLLGVIKNEKEVLEFPWEEIEEGFVVKPGSGFGGEGVLLIRRRAKWAGEWFLMDGTKINISGLRYHCFDILQGKFSLHNLPDYVLVEERVKIFGQFLRFTKIGAPDIRIIIFNQVPVMAMLRIPTEESKGKANLHQGAIGLGLDMATGITTYGVYRDQLLEKIYDLKRKKMVKVNGIRIPLWEQVLRTAIAAQKAVSGLNFVGVDIVLDKEKGPLILELNARPGLAIQICNQTGLQERLKRIEGIQVRNEDHAINISRFLFGGSFVDKVDFKTKVKALSVFEVIKIKTESNKKINIIAKIDTGAHRTSIDKQTAKDLGLLKQDNILYYRHYKSSLGKRHRRPVIGIVFWLRGRKIITSANVTNRSHLRTKVLIGKRDLQGFTIEIRES